MRTKSIKKNKINVVTLGCSKNVYDSEVLMGQLQRSGKDVVHEADGNIVVINTCGFINNAKEESINTILEYADLKERGLVDKVFVTGCLSERYRDDLQKEIPNIDQYFGTTQLPQLLKALEADYKQELLGDRLTTTPKHYAYLKISEGCNKVCSFCAIPLIRGKHISQPIEKLVDEATLLAKSGVKELILIAQDLTFYGIDIYKELKLAELLKQLALIDGIEWIRLHYAYPAGFPLDVLEVMKQEPKICKYIDIPLQHISTHLLQSMKRGTTRDKTTQLLATFRQEVPGIAIRTTLIVGYPGETQEDFDELKQWVAQTKFDRLGCFTYSHEENTSAFALQDNVPETVKQARAAEIMDIQSNISWELNQQKVGRTYRCIIDRKEGTHYVARSEYDSPDVDNEILIDANSYSLNIGQFIQATITEATDFDLYALPIQ